MSRFQSSSSTGSVPGATSSNSTTNMSALRGRGYQVPQTSSIPHTSHIRPLRVLCACDNKTELSLEPSTLQPPSNKPGNLSSSTTLGPTSPKNTKKIQNPIKQSQKKSFPLSSSSSTTSSSSYYSDSVSYESIDWSALKLPPGLHMHHPNATTNRYRSPTMYSDSTTKEWINSSQGSGSSDLFPIHSPCIRVDPLPGTHAPTGPYSIPFVTNLPFDPFGDHPTSSSFPLPHFPPPPRFIRIPPPKRSSPMTQQSFSLHHSLSSSSSSSSPPPPSPAFPPTSLHGLWGFPSAERSSPTTQQSFSLHHSLSSSSSSSCSPSLSIASLHIPTFLSFSRSSSVLAEDGTQTIPPQQPVFYKQIQLFRNAKKQSFSQCWYQLNAEEEVLMARAKIVTPDRPFQEASMMSISDSDGEVITSSPLSDPFLCSPTPFVYSPSPSPTPQRPQRKSYGRFIDARPPTVVPHATPNDMYDSTSTEDETDTTDYPSSLDDYPQATPEPETTPLPIIIAPEKSWIHRHQKTIKKFATWGLIAAAIILPKMLWKW